MRTVFLVATLMLVAAFAKVPTEWAPTVARPGEIAQAPKQHMTVALKRRNMDKLNKIFWEVSDPASPKYGEHLGNDEMRALVSPGADAIGTVVEWLNAAGIRKVNVARHEDSIAFDASVAEVAALMNVEFGAFENVATGQRAVRATSAGVLPEKVSAVVEVVAGHRGFPLPPRKIHSKKVTKEMSFSGVTPAVIYDVYNQNYFPPQPAGSKKNIQSFFQAQGQYVEASDLTTFCQQLDSSLDCKISKYIGTNDGSAPGIESSLDSEYISATGRATETWVYSYSSDDFCGDLTRWAQDVFGEADGTFPFVISMSYGAQRYPTYCSSSDQTRLNTDIQKMGAMGITVVIASGDSGNGYQFFSGKLASSMPAEIPYATAVGATTFISGNSGQEQAVTSFGSGGGFSYIYDIPSYQASDVAGFFAKDYKLPPSSMYNANGRGTPDVAALGENFNIISGGQWEQVGGTSCATPTFAGMVTMLNNIRLENNKTLGFLNPLLYKNPTALTDITVGQNGKDRSGISNSYGWYCVKGWDAATGLGTLNWGAMADVVKGLNSKERQHA